MTLQEIIEAHGGEITWEVLKCEESWLVWASHNGGPDSDDSFKFCAGWRDLDIAAEDVHRQIQKHGPEWARVQTTQAQK